MPPWRGGLCPKRSRLPEEPLFQAPLKAGQAFASIRRFEGWNQLFLRCGCPSVEEDVQEPPAQDAGEPDEIDEGNGQVDDA